MLLIQGTMDEIIPENSHTIIVEALQKGGNSHVKTVLLEGASHSISHIGRSDFPYWSKLHKAYLPTVEEWIKGVDK